MSQFSLASLQQTADGDTNANGNVTIRPDELAALIEVVLAAQGAWTYIHALSKTLPTHALRMDAADARVPLSIALEPFGEHG